VVIITQAKIKPAAGTFLYETSFSFTMIFLFCNIGFHM